jgi:hypothetical protein
MQTSDAQYTGFKNRIINGAMVLNQRGATLTTNGYCVDRFNCSFGSATGSYQQSTTAPTGFKNSLVLSVTTGAATAAGDFTGIYQPIEGFNIADLDWGSASAKTITLSFWVRSSIAGNYGLSLRNATGDRAYVASYTVNSVNTWENKTITVPGCTDGTWVTNNGVGTYVTWDMGVGSTYSTTAGSSWVTGNYFGLTGGVKIQATTGASFYITGVQFEKGSTATSFDYRSYGTELALCQRYYFKIGANPAGSAAYQAFGAGGMQAGNTTANIFLPFKQTMRATPTITYSGNVGISSQGNYTNISSLGSGYGGVDSSLVQPSCGAVGQAGYGAILLANADANAFVAMSSEL